MNKVVLFAANRGYALTNSRKSLIELFIKRNWKVVICTSDDEESRKLRNIGVFLEEVKFSRGGISPLHDLLAYFKLKKILKKYSPSLVHFFHAKPVIIGTIAARSTLKDNVKIINTITGLGHAFIKQGLVTILSSIGYRTALPKSDMTIFQNSDDQKLFLNNKWVSKKKAILVLGAGIQLEKFPYRDRSTHDSSRPVVGMIGRLINQKGIPEFAEVAKKVIKVIPLAKFCLVGEEDPVHPDAVDMKWLKKQNHFEYLGKLSDINSFLIKLDLLLFTSYREGMPRAVMEAASTGLPSVAFDVSGVRESVQNGKTGYLVPEKDVQAMTNKVIEILIDKKKRLNLGMNANEYSMRKFDVKNIQKKYINIYQDAGIPL